ncbi:hypothetical protein [Cyanobacterium aponinum]|uniref:Uncharacterized protein n=1 Tax=Cyanobacterium aponinum (strain PCC 10605) TaxID=755178 RepID=K9Z3L4_CYAAP|nr:hypothetical protein [Cyanobacterium aponinum]AFZ53332.1 hypothetical protein Cyan10605_1213 [Cyanobacterium aponinum PCC 10605]
MRRFWNLATSIIFIIFCISVIGYLQIPITSRKSQAISKEEAIKQEKRDYLTLTFLKNLPNFGFNNLVADWIYLRFVQYFGDESRDLTGYTLNPEYFTAFVDKDPRFIEPYFIFAPATTLFSGRPDVSVDLMSKGLQAIQPQQPKAYQVWYYKGIDELLFTSQPRQAKISYQIAAQWAKYHDNPEAQNLGQLAQDTANFLKENPNSKKAQGASWMSIYTNAREDSVRELALQNIERLGGELRIEGNRATLTFPEEK